jgi:hypothetical protein
MSTQYEKTVANAEHLLDGFIALRERYAFLHPMIFDKELVQTRGSGPRGRGFETLRQSLLLTCIQDIAKLTLDRDRRAPSLANIASSLADSGFRNDLRERYSVWPSVRSDPDKFKNPALLQAVKALEVRETQERRTAFNDAYKKFSAKWGALKDSSILQSFVTIRDKVTAHTELRFENAQYKPLDISTLGIKYGDIKSVIEQVQDVVALAGVIVRNSSFDWDSLILDAAVKSFWT